MTEGPTPKIIPNEACKHGFTHCVACHEGGFNDPGWERVNLPEDMVNRPSHYNNGEIECIDAIKAMLGEEGFVAYCRGNAVKYQWRAGLKFNTEEDMAKSIWYTRMADGDDPRLDARPPNAALRSAASKYKKAVADGTLIVKGPRCAQCDCRTVPCDCARNP